MIERVLEFYIVLISPQEKVLTYRKMLVLMSSFRISKKLEVLQAHCVSIVSTVCEVFVDFSCSHIFLLTHFLFFPNTRHYSFLSVHLQTVALSILFSSNAFWIILFPGLVFKTFLCCDDGAKQPLGKCELHRKKIQG